MHSTPWHLYVTHCCMYYNCAMISTHERILPVHSLLDLPTFLIMSLSAAWTCTPSTVHVLSLAVNITNPRMPRRHKTKTGENMHSKKHTEILFSWLTNNRLTLLPVHIRNGQHLTFYTSMQKWLENAEIKMSITQKYYNIIYTTQLFCSAYIYMEYVQVTYRWVRMYIHYKTYK